MNDTAKNLVDVASLGTFLGYILSALPVVALVFTVLWALFRLLEMRTVHVALWRLFGWRLDRWLDLPGNPYRYKDHDDGE